MSFAWRCVAACLGLLAALHGPPALGAQRALLVGVSTYPLLPSKSLVGPGNDVLLMAESLARLGFPGDLTVTLSEASGEARWPTRANILHQLDQLAGTVDRGDWVLLYFSGHGAQVPQQRSGHGYREPDGLDEVFLPRDTARWDPQSRRVDGAILDDEFGVVIEKIRARGVAVWVIFDTCHSGDMMRGPVDVADKQSPVQRYVSPADLGIPAAEWGKPAVKRRPPPRGARPGLTGAWVAFFASQPDEPTLEEWLPDPVQPGIKRRYGLFTYELSRALMGWHGDFRQLERRLRLAYERRPFPTPMFSGQLSSRPPFGASLSARVQ